MTAVVCWERAVGPLTELVVAADSRLSGGEEWDSCPKLFNLGRSDAVLAFAGHTERAYPMVLQAISMIGAYGGHDRRQLDVPALGGQLCRVLDDMLSRAVGVAADEDPHCEFLLAGWSWRLGRFRAYKVNFDATRTVLGRPVFVSTPVGSAPPGLGGAASSPLYATIGDAGRRLTSRLTQRRLESPYLRLDMEPLDALVELCADPATHTVGGVPQVGKVYRTMRSEPFVVSVGGTKAVGGRPLLYNENYDLRVLSRDPDGWSVEPS